MDELRRCPEVPVSWGELLDKITILAIKLERIECATARANVTAELVLLVGIAGEALQSERLAAPIARLRAVNEQLWVVEDDIRRCEAGSEFGHTFVELARSVYRLNDRRAAIKREINDLLGSELVEEKSYASVVAPTFAWSEQSPSISERRPPETSAAAPRWASPFAEARSRQR